MPACSASAATASVNGTSIPPVSQTVDRSGNTWTIKSGTVYENGKKTASSANIIRLVYLNNTIYQENSAKNWSAWNGSRWTSTSNPEKASANGTAIPTATLIIDTSGNNWTIISGVVYVNGALAGHSANVIELLYLNGVIYQETSASAWSFWNGSGWASTSNLYVSPSGTTIPPASQIIDAKGNVWTVVRGVVYENKVAAAYSANVTEVLYQNGVVYQENSTGGWWYWNGSG
jgi:hypothetical protein